MLQLKKVRKTYDVGDIQIHAMDGIDVAFRKNEFVSILGPSGCGKTTLMNIVGGLDQYTSGDLLINGQSTKKFKDNDWDNYRNKRIGFVFQSYNLIMHQSVLGNVELALTLSGISPSERKERAIKVLTEVGLEKHIYKKPNQLSGGQMQRVAIARALVNEPEILLADEPTGALDTETSVQILDLIKKVAEDRLVIMVTHNSDLAHEYSNRVINMLDGQFTDDSNPYDGKPEKEIKKLETAEVNKGKDKTSMSFLTAMSLSFKNLLTKKWRTLLTAIAGSIGIIGVALILAVSSGTNDYVDKIQQDTLFSNPLEISETSFDPSAFLEQMQGANYLGEKFPSNEVIKGKAEITLAIALKQNNITEEFIDHLKNNLDSKLYNEITFSTGMNLEFYKEDEGVYQSTSDEEINMGPFGTSGGNPMQMLANEEFVKSQYDIIAGSYPTSKEEIVLIVNEYNQVSSETLRILGLLDGNLETDSDGNVVLPEYTFNQLLGTKMYAMYNNTKLSYDGNKFIKETDLTSYDLELTVTGIIRINSGTTMGMINKDLGFTKALREEIKLNNEQSDIVNFMKNNQTIDPFTGDPYTEKQNEFGVPIPVEKQHEANLRAYGGGEIPNNIKIYSKDFTSKEKIISVIDDYNNEAGRSELDQIGYMDPAALFGSLISQVINIITIILVAFTSISLVVSSIMIGIITYVSVLERNKEIGILRSIGARKKDITRVFNAETFIIGMISGIIGIGTTYLLSIPANIIIAKMTDVKNIANLPILSALVLIVITVGLTVLAGLIPARGASKKDPVEALRTE